jgi:hypothetical protein
MAMAFSSVDGCLQVWEDVQALQEAAMGFDGAAHDTEAQPGSFDLLAMVFRDPIEPFEDER